MFFFGPGSSHFEGNSVEFSPSTKQKSDLHLVFVAYVIAHSALGGFFQSSSSPGKSMTCSGNFSPNLKNITEKNYNTVV